MINAIYKFISVYRRILWRIKKILLPIVIFTYVLIFYKLLKIQKSLYKIFGSVMRMPWPGSIQSGLPLPTKGFICMASSSPMTFSRLY